MRRRNEAQIAAAADRHRALLLDELIGDPRAWRYIADQAAAYATDPRLDVVSQSALLRLRSVATDLAAMGEHAQEEAS